MKETLNRLTQASTCGCTRSRLGTCSNTNSRSSRNNADASSNSARQGSRKGYCHCSRATTNCKSLLVVSMCFRSFLSEHNPVSDRKLLRKAHKELNAPYTISQRLPHLTQ